MKIIIATSTMPVSDDDKVPAFVKDQAIAIKQKYPKTEIIIHAPHNHHSQTSTKKLGNEFYTEHRFHYFWPRKWELLTGRGIVPALRSNKLLYLQIPFLFVCQFASLLLLVVRERPDLIYAHWFTPQAINASIISRLTKTPFVFTTHASDVAVLKPLPFSRQLVGWVCKQARHITAVSVPTADRLKSFFTRSKWQQIAQHKLSIIPMGVHLPVNKPTTSQLTAVRSKFHIPSNKTYVLFIGRLAEIKGVKYLIEAFSLLPKSYVDKLHLIIAGDGHIRKHLAGFAKQQKVDNISFTGYIHGSDKEALLDMADILCLPSIIDSRGHKEGLPVSMMEGMSYGKIVIASQVSGAEAIITSGKNGILFKQKSATAIKDALLLSLNMAKSDKSRMQSAAKKLSKEFEWDKIIDEYYQIFNKSIGAK